MKEEEKNSRKSKWEGEMANSKAYIMRQNIIIVSSYIYEAKYYTNCCG